MAGAFDEVQLSATQHAGDPLPDVDRADWVRCPVHVERRLSIAASSASPGVCRQSDRADPRRDALRPLSYRGEVCGEPPSYALSGAGATAVANIEFRPRNSAIARATGSGRWMCRRW